MSFRCDYCGVAQPAGSKPVLQTPADSWRKKTYECYDVETETMIRVEGREPMTEFKTCRACLGLEPIVPVVEPSLRTLQLQTNAYHEHVRNCKGFKTFKRRNLAGEEIKESIPCHMCELVMRDFAAFPSTILSRCLEDPLKAPRKEPLYLLVRDHMIDRVTDKSHAFMSKRAERDGMVAINLLKQFSKANPKLLRG